MPHNHNNNGLDNEFKTFKEDSLRKYGELPKEALEDMVNHHMFALKQILFTIHYRITPEIKQQAQARTYAHLNAQAQIEMVLNDTVKEDSHEAKKMFLADFIAQRKQFDGEPIKNIDDMTLEEIKNVFGGNYNE